jgi:hypothetical protein
MQKSTRFLIIISLAAFLSGCSPVMGQAPARYVEKELIAGISVQHEQDLTPESSPPSAITPLPFIPVTMNTISISEEASEGNYSLQANYPYLVWGEDPRVIPFNQAVEEMIDAEIDRFEGYAAEVEPMPDSDAVGGFLDINYRLVSSAYGILAFEFFLQAYITPAAHPWSHTITMNYDMVAGEMLTLDGLFTADSPYLEVLSTFCLEDLQARDAILWDTGALPLAENYQIWNITDEGLLVTFDEYQVTAYAYGPQSVLIPYRRLESVIPLDSRLAAFLE